MLQSPSRSGLNMASPARLRPTAAHQVISTATELDETFALMATAFGAVVPDYSAREALVREGLRGKASVRRDGGSRRAPRLGTKRCAPNQRLFGAALDPRRSHSAP